MPVRAWAARPRVFDRHPPFRPQPARCGSRSGVAVGLASIERVHTRLSSTCCSWTRSPRVVATRPSARARYCATSSLPAGAGRRARARSSAPPACPRPCPKGRAAPDHLAGAPVVVDDVGDDLLDLALAVGGGRRGQRSSRPSGRSPGSPRAAGSARGRSRSSSRRSSTPAGSGRLLPALVGLLPRPGARYVGVGHGAALRSSGTAVMEPALAVRAGAAVVLAEARGALEHVRCRRRVAPARRRSRRATQTSIALAGAHDARGRRLQAAEARPLSLTAVVRLAVERPPGW